MRASRLFTLAVAAILPLLMMACKDTPVTPPTQNVDPNAIKGTWLIESADGVSVINDGGIWTFTGTQYSFTNAKEGCRTVASYTTSGNKVFSVYQLNECGVAEVGDRDTMTWTLNGSKLTATQSGVTLVMRKLAGNDRPVGSWYATKVNGQDLAAGAGIGVYIYGSNFEMYIQNASGMQCKTLSTYTNNGTTLTTTVTEDTCGDYEVGDVIPFTWTTNGETMRLTDVGGFVIDLARL